VGALGKAPLPETFEVDETFGESLCGTHAIRTTASHELSSLREMPIALFTNVHAYSRVSVAIAIDEPPIPREDRAR